MARFVESQSPWNADAKLGLALSKSEARKHARKGRCSNLLASLRAPCAACGQKAAQHRSDHSPAAVHEGHGAGDGQRAEQTHQQCLGKGAPADS